MKKGLRLLNVSLFCYSIQLSYSRVEDEIIAAF